MRDPETYAELMMQQEEIEREDAQSGHVPAEPFGAEVARRLSRSADFKAWCAEHVSVETNDEWNAREAREGHLTGPLESMQLSLHAIRAAEALSRGFKEGES
jgi:hypothetical protein